MIQVLTQMAPFGDGDSGLRLSSRGPASKTETEGRESARAALALLQCSTLWADKYNRPRVREQ